MNDSKPKKSIITKLRNYFFAGIVVLIPVGITIYLTIFIEKVFSDLLPMGNRSENTFSINIVR